MEKNVEFKSKGVTLRGVLNMPEGPGPEQWAKVAKLAGVKPE